LGYTKSHSLDNISNKKFVSKNKFVWFLIKTISSLAIAMICFVLFLMFINKIIGIDITRKVLVSVTVLLELIILFKTSMKDIPNIFSREEVEHIPNNFTIKSYSHKIYSIFKGVIKSQAFLVVPFFVLYVYLYITDQFSIYFLTFIFKVI